MNWRFARGLAVFSMSFGSMFALGCSKQEEPPPAKIEPMKPVEAPTVSKPAPTISPAAAAQAQKEVVWEAPPAWTTVPNPSTFRKATYKIPKTKGDTEDAEMSVSVAGGGLDANIARWSGQFEGKPAPKRSTRKVGDLEVTVVELEGTYSSGMPGAGAAGPKPKTKMLAAIVTVGDDSTFFKLVGPQATVDAARKDFDGLVGSLKTK